MISIYSPAYNLIKNGFNIKPVIQNWVRFATHLPRETEIVIAVNKGPDGSFEAVSEFAKKFTQIPVRVFEAPFELDDQFLDGKVKNFSLQCTTKDSVKIQMDLDEIFPCFNYSHWAQFADFLTNQESTCLMIPTVDLWGSWYTIQDKQIGYKFRMHSHGLQRGVWNKAWKDEAHTAIDITKSDSSEVITANGDLPQLFQTVSPDLLGADNTLALNNRAYTIHLGYLDFNRRMEVNEKFWDEHWAKMGGTEKKPSTSLSELASKPVVRHNLSVYDFSKDGFVVS